MLLEFPNTMAVSTGDGWQPTASITEQRIRLRKGESLNLACRGDARVYALDLSPTHQDCELALRREPRTGAVQLLAGEMDKGSHHFVLSAEPILGERLLHGAETHSYAESPFAYVIYPPLGPGNLHWISCLLQPTSVPLNFTAQVPNRYPVPYLGFATDEGLWVLGGNQPEGERRELAVCLIGRPTAKQVRSLVDAQVYRRIYVVTDDKRLLVKWARHLGVRSPVGRGAAELPAAQIGGTSVRFLRTEWTASSLEDVNMRILRNELAESPYNDAYREAWEHIVGERLPPVPVVPDPRVGSICVLINLLRGRVPDTTAEALDATPADLSSDDLWLTPWAASDPLSVEQLAEELIVRSTGEYLAMQHLKNLGITFPHQDSGASIPEDQYPELAAIVDAWLCATPKTVDGHRARLREGLLRIGASARSIAALFADRVHRMPPEVRHRAGVGMANPFVIPLIENETPWYQLSLDLAHWTLYAACASRKKAGVIAPAPVDGAMVANIKQAIRNLRYDYHVREPELRSADIVDHRRAVGRLLQEAVGSGVLEALDRVGADRVVAFSDVGLEYLPFRDSVLGMEFPISRLPVSWPAMWTGGNAVSSATRGQSLVRGGSMTRGSKAVILVADTQTDRQTEWSQEIASHARDRLRWVGLIAEMPSTKTATVKGLLEACMPAAVVLFFGHATASGDQALLRLDEEKAITAADVLEHDWKGKLIVLVGCETAVQDSEERDIASAFLKRGARAVIGTSSKVSVKVADYLFTQLFDLLIDGMPIDYAFFLARRRSAAFETLRTTMSSDEAADRIADAVARKAEAGPFVSFMDALGLCWSDMEHDSVYAPTFSLLGGSGETLA
ncbi:CHAT domain-containing protein [Streptomyces regalis]|uniref:CHAT domain-containing protein n=1 Tax=Streptomyces regalis TaxID=68262 RepID=A0A0X3VGZ1_9ACTN|nr:CHAT domain-containing protein [Streptomyces regalis]KUL44081.1 hypothetical protein ADL12_05930 [Streptomyces regalis]